MSRFSHLVINAVGGTGYRRLVFAFNNKCPSVAEQVANNHNRNNNAAVSTQMS